MNLKNIIYFLFVFSMLAGYLFCVNAEIDGDDLKKVTAKRIDKELVIDGRLDESEWKDAPLIGPLTQVDPDEGAKPSQKTEVRVLYNKDFLYFGITAYEDDLSDCVAYQMEKDSDPYGDDFIGILLDTFHDKQNAYLFTISPVGMKWDGVVVNNAEEPDGSWNGIWYAETMFTGNAWQAEIAIPFKTLSFNPKNDTWGFNVVRLIKRFEEVEKWAYPYQDANEVNPALAGELRGLEGMEQGVGLDIRPFTVGSYNKQEPSEEAEFTPDAGVDFFYNITPSLKLSATVNTDFAETEVDSRQINLTRFPITYPEKRDFFIEGAGMFQIPRLTSDLIPFFSRRIGLYEGEEVPIQFGTKLTGRVGEYNIGFLDVQTGEKSGLEGQNLLALRVTRNLWEQSHIGMIFTNGNPSGEGYNRLYGMDFKYGTSELFGNKNFYVMGNYLLTEDEMLPDEDRSSWKISIDFPNDQIDASVDCWQIGENFNPALGYLRRPGIQVLRGHCWFGPRSDIRGIRRFSTAVFAKAAWDNEGRLVEVELDFDIFGITLDSGDWLELNVEYIYDLLQKGFEIHDGIIIQPEEYEFTSYEIELGTAGKRPVFGYSFIKWGDYYDGTATEMYANIGLKFSKHLFLFADYWFKEVDLMMGSFIARNISTKITLKINPDLSWNNIIQYDNYSDMLGVFSKVRWILKEGNELYFVVQRNWEKKEDGFIPYNWRADLKFFYTFRF